MDKEHKRNILLLIYDEVEGITDRPDKTERLKSRNDYKKGL